MTTTVNLKIKQQDGSVKTTPFEVEGINLYQFEDVMKIVKNAFVELQKDDALQGLLESLFANPEGETEEQALAMEQRFLQNLVGGFDVLLVEMPSKAFEMISTLSGIELEVLKKQSPETAFDVFDAILEANNVEKLVERAKKSLAKTKAKMTFLNLKRKATDMVKSAQA